MSLLAAARPWQDAVGRRGRAAESEAAVLSDAELLARSGADAQPSFGEVMRRHGGPLYAVAYRQLDSVPDAEEVVQDAFLLLWRKRGRIHLVGDSALPWLIVTVKHLAANRRRARVRRTRYETASPPDPGIPEEERTAVTDLLDRAFAALPPLDARIARLCLAEDVTYAEAAAQLGLTEGAVRNRLSRARAKLRKDLEGGR